jgi:c-di-GMP-binding flagellar brake protein YcgR
VYINGRTNRGDRLGYYCGAAIHLFPMLVISVHSTSQTKTKEQRRYPRKAFCHEGKILVQGGAPLPFKTLDISEGGIGGLVQKPFPTGGNCVIALDVVLDSMMRRINVWGEIVHWESDSEGCRVGIQYRDFDTMSRLFLLRLAA